MNTHTTIARISCFLAAICAVILAPIALAGTKPAPDTSGVGATKSVRENASFSGSAGITYYVATNGSDSNSGTSQSSPFKTIQKAIDEGEDEYELAGKNVKIKIAPGTYRESFLLDYASGQSEAVILQRDGSSGTVTITGASNFNSGWTNEGNGVYSHSWTTNWGFGDSPWNSQDAVLNPSVLARREGVFSGGTMLEQIVGAGTSLSDGQFRVDEGNDKIKIKDSSLTFTGSGSNLTASKNIEVTTRLDSFEEDGCRIKNTDNVKIVDLNFIRFPTLWQRAGLGIDDVDNLWIRTCTFEQNSASGLRLNRCDKIQIEQIVSQSNGSLGMGGTTADRLWMLDSTFQWNNKRGAWMGYAKWYIAGFKIGGYSDKTKIVDCDFLSNNTHGLWFDVDCTNSYVKDCIMTDNYLAGNETNALFYEISSGPAKIEGCAMGGSTFGAYISNSWNVYLYNNDILDNEVGQVALRNHPSRPAPSPGPFCKNFWMENNRISTVTGAKLVMGKYTNNTQYQNCLNDATINNNNDYSADIDNVFEKVLGTATSFSNWKSTSSPVRDTIDSSFTPL